jgi:hypothetical protein
VKKYIETHNAHEPFEQDIWFSLPVVQKGDGRVMGLVSLVCKDHRQGPCGWALGVEYRGQGYATEAASGLLSYGFGTLGLHRISATLSGNNWLAFTCGLYSQYLPGWQTWLKNILSSNPLLPLLTARTFFLL